MLSEEGWIKSYRSMMSWQWHSDSGTLSLWMHLLWMANYKDEQWQGITIKAGQVVTSVKSLCTITGLSKKEIDTRLKRLVSTGEISIKSGNKFSIITICNYGTYQDIDESKGKQRGNKGETKGKQRGTDKEIKEINNNNYSSRTCEDEFGIEAKTIILRKIYLDSKWVEDMSGLMMIPKDEIQQQIENFVKEMNTDNLFDESKDEDNLIKHLKNYVRNSKRIKQSEKKEDDYKRTRDKRRGYDVSAKDASEYGTVF